MTGEPSSSTAVSHDDGLLSIVIGTIVRVPNDSVPLLINGIS